MKTKTICLIFSFLTASLAQAQQEGKIYNYSNITEFGIINTSPKGASFEITSVNGFSINDKHHFGLGLGIGGGSYETYQSGTAYMPVFLNYRFYFSTNEKLSPHINAALGYVSVDEGSGIYSVLTAGFRRGNFSFSTGFSFTPVCREEYFYDYSHYSCVGDSMKNEWHYPFGIVMKLGFTL